MVIYMKTLYHKKKFTGEIPAVHFPGSSHIHYHFSIPVTILFLTNAEKHVHYSL
jgi:hypothetical protein